MGAVEAKFSVPLTVYQNATLREIIDINDLICTEIWHILCARLLQASMSRQKTSTRLNPRRPTQQVNIRAIT